MNDVKNALIELGAAVERVRALGFVVTGRVAIVRPGSTGAAQPYDEGDIDPRGTFGEIRIKNRRAPGVPDEKPKPSPVLVAAASLPPLAVRSEVETLSGECCMKCGGHRLQQAGACKVCLDCGEAGGCG